MSTSIHIPEGLHTFHIGQRSTKGSAVTILLKRVVADLQRWLNCSWAAGMVPGGSELVPELNVVCVTGDTQRQEVPDFICPIRGDTNTGLAALIAVGPKNDGTSYSDQDRRLADALCEHIGGQHQDDEISRGVYDRLDHRPLQQIPGLEFGGQCQRADKSGGDFFELLMRGERNLVIAIGTVAARGLSGGIMLGGAVASVRAIVSRGESLVQVATELNRTQWELSPDDSFTSFLCVQVDPLRSQLRYVNAGHEPALLLRGRSNRVDRLEATGPVLGLSHRSIYRENSTPFDPGDLLAAFTDGIAESTGPSGVVRILREGPDCGVQDLAAHILGAEPAKADRTIVLVRSSDSLECPIPERYEMVAA